MHAAGAYTFSITVKGAGIKFVNVDGHTSGTDGTTGGTSTSKTVTFETDTIPTTITKIRARKESYSGTWATWSNISLNTSGTQQTLSKDGVTITYTATLTSNHTHSWSVTASGNTITTKCDGSGTCPQGYKTEKKLTLDADEKTYNGSVQGASTSGSYYSQAGTPGSIYYEGASGTSYSKTTNKPTNVGTYTASVTLGSATATKQFTISPKQLTLNWGSTTTFDYNGELHAPTASISGVLSGDTCNVSVGGAEVNAGNHTATASLTGANASNYKLPNANTKAFTINKKLIDLTGVLLFEPKEYDSTTVAVLDDSSDPKISGVLPADVDYVEIDTVSGSYSDKNVGTGKAVTATASLTGNKSGNYEVNPLSGLSADITPKTVTVTDGIAANDKDYDGNTDATIDASKAIIDGLCDGDNLTVSATGTFNDANVGENIPVNLTYGALGGTDADNYVLDKDNSQKIAYAKIKALPMVVSAQDYEGEYDGNEHHITVTVTVPESHNERVITYKGPNDQEFTHQNPGFKDPGEYVVEYKVTHPHHITTTGSATVKIIGATFEGITSERYSAPYDRDSHGITVTVPDTYDEYKITYSTEENGTYSTEEIEFTNFTDGAKTVYYKVSKTGFYDFKGSNTVNITKIPVTISGIEAIDRVYNGTTNVELDFSEVNIDGLLEGETLDVTAKGSFADKNAGAQKTVIISDHAISGDYAKNYELAAEGQQTSAYADVSKQQIIVSGITSPGKKYDSKLDAVLNLLDEHLLGKVPGDKLTATATGKYRDPNQGSNKPIDISDLALSGDDVQNYELAPADKQQKLTYGDISYFEVTVTAQPASKYYGEKDPKFTYISDPAELIGDDKLEGELSRERLEEDDAGEYQISLGTLRDQEDNYAIVFKSAKFTILKAQENDASVSIEGWTYGDDPKAPSATATHGQGTATFKYSTSSTGEYTDTVPSSAGTYYVKAYIADTNNYPAAESAPVAFTIAKKTIELEWSDKQFTYDGKPHKPKATAKGLVVGDTCTVEVEEEKTDSNQKTGTENYEATAVSLSNDNYALPENKTTTFTIAPKKLNYDMLELTGGDIYIYDGSVKGPKIDMGDDEITVEDMPKVMKRGEDYTVTGVEQSSDYGTHLITIEGMGNYTGTLETSWMMINEKTNPDKETGKDGAGDIEVFVTIEGNTEAITVDNFTVELAKSILSEYPDDEQKRIKGEDILMYLEVIEISEDEVEPTDKNLIMAEFDKAKVKEVIRWFEIRVWKKVGNEAATEIHETSENIIMKIEVPDKYKKAPANHKRSFYLATYHSPFAKILTKTSKTEVEFASNEFSTFALAYKDTPNPDDRRLPKTGVE